MTLLDAWLPVYEFSERHSRRVCAEPEAVRRALHEIDVARIPLVRALMALRALPGLVSAPRATLARMRSRSAGARRLGLAAVDGFALLADEPREIVLGLTGRFWKASGEILPTDAASFRDAPPAGAARAATSFRRRSRTARRTSRRRRASTCPTRAARRAFRWYWRAIRPGSGLIRRAMLAALARAAERSGRAP